MGDGTQRRDFLFVTDVARAFYLAATKGRDNEIFNLGAGNPQTVNYLIELLGGGEGVLVVRKGHRWRERLYRGTGCAQVAHGGDGQVTLGAVVVKSTARKVRKLYRDQVLADRAAA